MKCKECEFCCIEEKIQYNKGCKGEGVQPFCSLQELFVNVNKDAECAENCNNDEWVIKHAIKKTKGKR